MNKNSCQTCSEHILDCMCYHTNNNTDYPVNVKYIQETEDPYDSVKHAFFMFLIDGLEEFAPDVQKKIRYKEAIDFVEDWVERNFDE